MIPYDDDNICWVFWMTVRYMYLRSCSPWYFSSRALEDKSEKHVKLLWCISLRTCFIFPLTIYKKRKLKVAIGYEGSRTSRNSRAERMLENTKGFYTKRVTTKITTRWTTLIETLGRTRRCFSQFFLRLSSTIVCPSSRVDWKARCALRHPRYLHNKDLMKNRENNSL